MTCIKVTTHNYMYFQRYQTDKTPLVTEKKRDCFCWWCHRKLHNINACFQYLLKKTHLFLFFTVEAVSKLKRVVVTHRSLQVWALRCRWWASFVVSGRGEGCTSGECRTSLSAVGRGTTGRFNKRKKRQSQEWTDVLQTTWKPRHRPWWNLSTRL